MQDIRIINEVMPVIEVNFDEVKAALSQTLAKYSGLVVTEETLMGCKATQKDLAGVRAKIDTYRKDKKKALSEPITVFENQCKELISLIEIAEQPIKDGIRVFDDKKREEKKAIAERLLKEVATTLELNEKYASRLTIDERYCNLTAKEIDVKNDLEAKAMVLKVEQDREAELIEIIKDSIDMENQKINSKLEFKDFERLVERGMSTKDILSEIKSRADGIFKAEHPEPKAEIKETPNEEPKAEVVLETAMAAESMYFASYRVTGTIDKLRSLSEFLKANGIAYKVVEQGEI